VGVVVDDESCVKEADSMKCDRCGQEMAGVKDSPSGSCRWKCLSCGNAPTNQENVERFATGAVRGTDVKGRYDLIPLVGLRRLAETCAEGARKYGENNWAKGIPSSNLLNHTLAHIANYLDGDRTEDHLAHAAWGIFCTMHNEERRPDVHFPPPPMTREEVREVMKEYEVATSSDLEVNGLPSNLGRGIKNPTGGGNPSLDAAIDVLKDVVRTSRFPDGRPVHTPAWFNEDPIETAISFSIPGGGSFIAEAIDWGGQPWITVDEVKGEFRARTAFSIKLSEVLRGAIASRLHASSPSGPDSPGLQQPSTPSDPSDRDFDEWMALRVRVDAANLRPWLDDRTKQWCARDSRDGTVHFFGPSDSDRDNAYRWADRMLSLSRLEPSPGTNP
jgi:hypothetical protein